MPKNTILKTQNVPWVNARKEVTSRIAWAVDSTTIPHWDNIKTFQAINLERHFEEKGVRSRMGNAIGVRVYGVSAAVPAGSAVPFEILLCRGKGSYFDRVAEVSAVLGDFKIYNDADGVSCAASARAADTLNVTTDYTGGLVGTHDAAGNSGFAHMWFHAHGANWLILNLLSTVNFKVGFEITTW